MAVMNRLVTLLFLAAVSAAPVQDPTAKCPNLTKLAPPLESCLNPVNNQARTTTTVSVFNLPKLLCLLYNESFNKLCESHDVDNNTWNETLVLVTKSPQDLCGALVTSIKKLNESEPWIPAFTAYINKKCMFVCTEGDNLTADACVKPTVFLKLIPEKKQTVVITKPTETEVITKTQESQAKLQTGNSAEAQQAPVPQSSERAALIDKPSTDVQPKIEKPSDPEKSSEGRTPSDMPLEEQEELSAVGDGSPEITTTPVAVPPSNVLPSKDNVSPSKENVSPSRDNVSPPKDVSPPVVKDEVLPPKLQNEEEAYKDEDEYANEDVAPKPAYNTPERVVESKAKPLETDEDINAPPSYANQPIAEDDSYFFSYFMMVCIVFILGYVGYHNKQKLLALVLEGRRGKKQQRRRPNSANYHKLDSNLEEAVTSACNKNTASVIY